MAVKKNTARARSGSQGAGARRTAARGRRAANDVTVRMYRQGLGDCFLIGFPKKGGGRFHLMIDCGVIQGAKGGSELINNAVGDIIATTQGLVDVLAVTHEHFDHVSGFVQAEAKFAKAGDRPDRRRLSVGEVWTAWTEDPDNVLGRKLRKERAERVKKLKRFAALQMETAIGQGVSRVLDFFDEGFGVAGGGGRTGKAMDIAKSLGTKPLRFMSPGDTWEHPDVEGVRVYVLGPPEDEAAIKRMMKESEVYHLASGAPELEARDAAEGAAFAFFAAAEGMPPPAAEGASDEERQAMERERDLAALLAERGQPFDRSERVPIDDVRSAATPSLQYLAERYLGAESWRRIDGAWTEAAAEFALQLDSYTNNTSLVLAIELVKEQKVLLFAADAQVGNWLTWGDVEFRIDRDTKVAGKELLQRTSFYKVGHHGSHNATLKAKGLEMMRRDGFTAFLSVNKKQAVQKGWNRMPLPAIVRDLEERSKGCLVRMDEDFKPSDTPESRAFAKRLTTTKLYVELAIPM